MTPALPSLDKGGGSFSGQQRTCFCLVFCFFFFSFFPVVFTEVLSGKRGWVLPAWEVTHHHPDWYSERVGTGKASRPLCCERNKAGLSRLGRV